jgi:hypothetical protein
MSQMNEPNSSLRRIFNMSQQKSIHATVTFPLAKQPYEAAVAPQTTVGEVRKDAMLKFQIKEEPQSQYYLTYKGERQKDLATVGEVAGHAEALKFTLVKELIQG